MYSSSSGITGAAGHRVMMTRSRRAQLLGDLSQESSSSSNNNNNLSSTHNNNNNTSNLSSTSSSSLLNSSSSSVLLSRKAPAMRCTCGKNSSTGISSLDVVICRKCNFGLHASCVGLVRPERLSTKDEQQAARLSLEIFICQFCLNESGGKIGGVKLRTTASSNSNDHRNKNTNNNLNKKKNGNVDWKKTTQAQLNAAVEEEQVSPEEELARIQKVHETPDRTILNQEPYRQMIASATEFLEKSGFTLITFPISTTDSNNNYNNSSKNTTNGSHNRQQQQQPQLSPAQIEEQVMECSRSSIQDATFSEEYPLYCVRELQSGKHPYLQGAAAYCRKKKQIVAIVMSNGRDPYCDLKQTVQNLKKQIASGKVKLLATPQDESKYASKFMTNQSTNAVVSSSSSSPSTKTTFSLNPTTGSRIRQRTVSSSSSSSSSSSVSNNILSCVTTDPTTQSILFRKTAAKFAQECLWFQDFDAVVHFTYIVTHEDYRGMKLAKTLMWIELARWALRGRKHACVNMALEKVYHTSGDSSSLEQLKKKFIIDQDDEENHSVVSTSASNIQPSGPEDESSKKNTDTNNISPRNSSSSSTTSNHFSNSRSMSNVVSSHHHQQQQQSHDAKNSKKQKRTAATKKTKQPEEEESDDDDEEEEESFLECRVTEASRRLYSGLTFTEVFPRYTSEGNLRWTRKEENAGRVMLSIDFPAAMLEKSQVKK